MLEADLQTRFSRWLKYHINFPLVYELKITNTKRLPFQRLLPHQKQALLKAKHGTLCYKIPDSGFGQKPWDGFCVNKSTSVVGIMFHDKRGENRVFLIDIDDFVQAEKELKTSITKDYAEKLAWRTITLG
jgi:penicillin-binding protein-related factor A (putative recombinase)